MPCCRHGTCVVGCCHGVECDWPVDWTVQTWVEDRKVQRNKYTTWLIRDPTLIIKYWCWLNLNIFPRPYALKPHWYEYYMNNHHKFDSCQLRESSLSVGLRVNMEFSPTVHIHSMTDKWSRLITEIVPFPAAITDVGLFSRVLPDVSNKGAGLGKALPTYQTKAWLLTCVHIRHRHMKKITKNIANSVWLFDSKACLTWILYTMEQISVESVVHWDILLYMQLDFWIKTKHFFLSLVLDLKMC